MRAFVQTIVETIRHPLVILDLEFRIKTANQAFCRTFAVAAAAIDGCSFFELDDGCWNVPQLRDMLARVGADGRLMNDFEIEQESPRTGRKRWSSTRA